MKRRQIRYLISIPFALILLAILYAGRLGANAQSLVSNNWNGAFYSSLSANGAAPDYGYPVDKNITAFPHLNLPGYPPIYMAPGSAPQYPPFNPGIVANPGNISGIAPAPNITATPPALTNKNPGGINPVAVPSAILTKSYSPSTIPADGATPSILTFTLTNPAGNPTLIGLAFTDTLPPALTVQGPGPNFCGPMNVTRNGNSVTVTGVMAAGPVSCTFAVYVRSTTPGVYVNNSSNISDISSNLDASGASATLTVAPPIKPGNPGKINPVIALSGNPSIASLSGNPGSGPVPPITNVDFAVLPMICKGSTYVTVVGLPGIPPNPVTVSWTAVPGATQYAVFILGKNVPAWGALGKTLASSIVPAPASSPISVTFNFADQDPTAMQDIHDILNAHGYFLIIVQAQNSDARFDAICNKTNVVRAVPLPPTNTPPPPPTWTPWPSDPGQKGKTCVTKYGTNGMPYTVCS